MKTSNSECSSPQETLLQHPFPCGKERERTTSSYKPILTKFFCAPSSFQDGGLEGSCRHSSSSRLYVQDRPQRCILCCSYQPGTPEATLLSVPECNLLVQMPTLRSHISTSSLHKSTEAPGGFCEEIGSKDMHLHRRHANPEFSKGGREASLMILLETLGFIVNMEKSILEFLGVLISSIHMSFSLPDSRVLNL